MSRGEEMDATICIHDFRDGSPWRDPASRNMAWHLAVSPVAFCKQTFLVQREESAIRILAQVSEVEDGLGVFLIG